MILAGVVLRVRKVFLWRRGCPGGALSDWLPLPPLSRTLFQCILSPSNHGCVFLIFVYTMQGSVEFQQPWESGQSSPSFSGALSNPPTGGARAREIDGVAAIHRRSEHVPI